MASELVGSLATEINFGFAPTEDSRKHINSLWVGLTWPTEVMRLWEVWARSAGDVNVLDAGLGQRQSQRLGTAPLRGVVP